MFSFIKRRWYIIVIILVIVGFLYFQRQTAITKSQQDNTYTVKRQTLEEELSMSGQIDAKEQVSLRFQSAGRLAWVGVKEGDYVNQNQGIASLDQSDVQKRLQRYLNTYKKARLDFDQTTYDNRTVNTGGLTKDQQERIERIVEKSQMDLDNAVIDVELQSLAAQYSYIYSPISGLVVKATPQFAGIDILPTLAEYVIVNPASVYFSATADQTDISKVSAGMWGDITLDSYPDSTFKGVVDSIAFIPKADEAGTVYGVKILFTIDNSQYRYRMGMTGDVTFSLRKKANAIAIPTRFIKSEAGKKYVYKIENGKKVKTYVKTGETYDISTEIVSGLKERDVITEQPS